jgi:dienelactone hydrolase
VHLKLRSHGRGGTFSATWVAVLVAVLGLTDVGAATQGAGPLRDPWARGSERFVRKWLVLGPVAAASAHLDANALQPAPGSAQALSEGVTSKWTAYAAYHDTVDLLEVFPRPISRGRNADPEVAYAYTTTMRAEDGDAIVSLASDNAVQLWVNGKLVHDQQSDRAFEFDGDQIPVRFAKGENRLLLKVVRVSGPSRLALRVLEAGFIGSRLTEIAPSILQAGANELAIRTHSHAEPGNSVQVEVFAAGGRAVARSQGTRGEVVHFETGTWSDGAYEVRLATQAADGHRVTSYLRWYKGDAIAAARRLLEQAPKAPDDSAGMTTRMLADMIRDRLGTNLSAAPDDAWLSVHSPLFEYEEIEQARAGEPGPLHADGFVRLAYEDEIDGSAQFCRTYLPPDYVASRSWPVILFLHGFNPANPPYVRWWSVDERHSPIAENHGVIYIEAHGRGNTQYLGIGEQDVMHCLSEAKKRLNVDEARVYLMGESMGGSGTWIVSSRHPDVFAAVAPVFGGWDFRVASQGGYSLVPRPDNTPPELFAQELQSSFSGAEGLLNVPVFVSHGDSDQIVNVDFSRHAVHMLQRWGYDVRFAEHPGRGHESLDNADEIADWMLAHQRVALPQQVRVRSADLAAARAYWVQVEAWQEPFRMIDVDAQVMTPGLIRLDTSNVAQITLSLPPALSGADGSIHVVWNGVQRETELRQGQAKLALSGLSNSPLNKRPGLEGGLSRLITTPFALVVGTTSRDAVMRQRCQAKADAFVNIWRQWQHVSPRVYRDDQITDADQRRYSLLLIGGPDDNRIARQLASRLPLKVARDGFTIDGRKYGATDAVVQMIYPNPLQPNRYVMVVAGTSSDGLYFWTPALWHTSAGFPTSFWDWTITDGRRVTLASSAVGAQRGWVAAGMFDQHWRRDDRWVYVGDSTLRHSGHLRYAPANGFTMPAQLLDAYAGEYELAPGVPVRVAHEGNHLTVQPPSGPLVQLDPEGKADFVVHDTGESVFFLSDEHGKVSGAVLNNAGQEIRATRTQAPP